MRVFIDAEPFYYYPSGISIYAEELIKALAETDGSLAFESSYATMSNAKFAKMQDAISKRNSPVRLGRTFLPGRLAARSAFAARALSWPRQTRPDIVHALSYMPPQALGFREAPLISTVHDLAFLRHPDKFFVPDSSATNKEEVGEVVRKAAASIAVSEFTKREMCDLLGCDGRRIHVVYEGTQWGDGEISQAPERVSAALAKFGLRKGSYLLAVGTISPRKNYETLLDAFERFAKSRPDASLAIVGSPGWNSEKIVARLKSAGERVKWLGGLDGESLKCLYLGANSSYMLSHYEGFGIPVLESMACGCPVCYASGSSMDEIAGDCGVRVAPTDVEAVVEAMRKFSEDPAWRDLEAAKSLKRSRIFTWRAAAEKTLNLYKSCSLGSRT